MNLAERLNHSMAETERLADAVIRLSGPLPCEEKHRRWLLGLGKMKLQERLKIIETESARKVPMSYRENVKPREIIPSSIPGRTQRTYDRTAGTVHGPA